MPHVWQILGGSTIGGGTYVVRRLCEHLLAIGCKVTVVASDPPTADLFRNLGCNVIEDILLPRQIHPPADSLGVARLARRLRRHGCDLLHSHTSKGGVVGRLAAAIAGVPRVVHHVHGFAFNPLYTPKARMLFYSAIERLAACFCHAMIFVNAADFELARRTRILRRSHRAAVVPNGVEPAPPAPPNGHASSSLRIGFLGRLAPQKGVDVLIDAAARLVPRAESLEVVIIGDGPLRQDLEQRARAQKSAAAFRFLGHRSDVADLIRQSDIVALPSRWEGHSISLLECMALGKPVVTTRIQGTQGTVNHWIDGLLVHPDDAGGLRLALQRLIDDPSLRSRLGRAAAQKVSTEFPASKMIDGILAVYRDLSLPVG